MVSEDLATDRLKISALSVTHTRETEFRAARILRHGQHVY